jgi:hypothetical protein
MKRVFFYSILLTMLPLFVSCDNGGDDAVGVTRVTLNKNTMALIMGETENIVATVVPINATNTIVKWDSSDIGVATVSNGTVTAVNNGTATITATSQADASKFAACIVTVGPEVASISLNRDKLTLIMGSTKQLWATAEPTGASLLNLSWSSSNPNVASVDSNGSITGMSSGKTTITATALNGKSASCAVTVPDVYVALQVGSKSASLGVIARLWVNGVAQDLCNLRETHSPNILLGSYASAVSVKVFNNDIYVAGNDTNLQNINVAKLWINGQAYALGDGVLGSKAMSVYILDNGDAYVAGYIQSIPGPGLLGDYKATLWKVDGQTREIQTLDLGMNGVLWDIVISDNCAYLSGAVYLGIAMLWEYDISTHTVRSYYLPDGNIAYRLAVSDTGDACMVGIGTAYENAKLWKMDGETKTIQSIYLDSLKSMGLAVAVSGNGDVYAAGEIGINQKARVWKIDSQTLEVQVLADLPRGCAARGIFLYGEDDLFVAGYGQPLDIWSSAHPDYSPKFWKIDINTPKAVETYDLLPYESAMQKPYSIFVK